MEEAGSSLSPIISGLIGGVIATLMVVFAKNKSERVGDARQLTFGILFKAFAFLLVPFTFFVLYAISQSYEGQEIAASLVGLGFLLGSIFFPYQAFFIEFSYDDKNVYFKSPIAGNKKVSWNGLRKVGYSWLLQADYIVVDGIGRIWCSNMLQGYGELMEFLAEIDKNNES
ncbi:hypothetical protein PAT01_39350 [Pseudoalteromonas atlantica]|uniref:Uncharacterized protein n=1 Tax=Pseudoalteromonas atlantica TaxID=288 RepID=A0ABQ0UJJ5_PSEAF|nr:hypothetical protein PAT01_39350 [Pseudoalteromonas atlantica]|tara:strand:+ start:1124 stop:1636 length:513 start_codon:yes stop_codon:yes gene_type:complete